MKDCKGQELHIGDEVVFVYGKNSDAILLTGKVTKFYTGSDHKDECSVDGNSHVNYHRL